MAEPRPAGLEFSLKAPADALERRWQVCGRLDFRHAGRLRQALTRALPPAQGRLILELSDLHDIDSVGTALLVNLWRLGAAHGFEVRLEAVPDPILERLELYRVCEVLPERQADPGWIEALGAGTVRARQVALQWLVLAADVTLEAAWMLARPWTLRWRALLEQSVLVGSRAVGIVALITFLVGLTLAFQSAYQLRQFGAAIYVASLTSISMVREMGPLITAILVVGRSGSAITSEVATMKVNEEIDALKMMGIPFTQLIAVPRLLALMVTLPLLTLISDVVGIAGGWIVGVVYLELSSVQYLRETINVLLVSDVVFGVVKPVVFGWGVGIIALFQGLQVEGGAQEVGAATTASVVQGIFYIILVTSVFSVVYYVFWPW